MKQGAREPNENLFLRLKPFPQTIVLPQVTIHRSHESGLLSLWTIGGPESPGINSYRKVEESSHLLLRHPHCLRVQGSKLIQTSAESRWQGSPCEGKQMSSVELRGKQGGYKNPEGMGHCSRKAVAKSPLAV